VIADPTRAPVLAWSHEVGIEATRDALQLRAALFRADVANERIFNPVTQSQRFDPRGAFIRRYLPQLAGLSDRQVHAPWLMTPDEQARDDCVVGRDYPAPIVDHASARARTLQRYAVVKAGGP